MSSETSMEAAQSRDAMIRDRSRRVLLSHLSGMTKETLATRYLMSIDDITETINSALEDLRDVELQEKFQQGIVARLIEDIKSLEAWEVQLKFTYKRQYQAVVTVGPDTQEIRTLEEDADDKMMKIKLIDSKRALYNLLMQVIRLRPETGSSNSARERVNSELLNALVSTAKSAGRAEERATRTIDIDAIDG